MTENNIGINMSSNRFVIVIFPIVSAGINHSSYFKHSGLAMTELSEKVRVFQDCRCEFPKL